MADLEQRVIALETRVEALTAEVAHSTDLSTTAGPDALTARQAHQRNIELLNALRRTQAEHSQTLAEHSRTLAEHSVRFDRIDERFDRIDQRLDGLDGLHGRMQTIEVSLGQLTVGMHTIEGLLTRLVDDNG